MSTIIDRRETYQNRSSSSRQKFIKRNKEVIKKGIEKAIQRSKGIKDIVNSGNSSSRDISIPDKDIDEPQFVHGKGGTRDRVLPGNDIYRKGDAPAKPPQGGGAGGREGAADGEGDDAFVFSLSKDEFVDLIFEGCELPDLVKKNTVKTTVRELVHSGLATEGSPAQLDVIRSYKNSIGRRIGTNRKELKAELAILEEVNLNILSDTARAETEARIEEIKAKLRSIPFFDKMDLRFRQKEWISIPSTHAVMFCLMDVSGSMYEIHKTIAKYFFILLYLFVERQYTNIDVVFVRHTQVASEVDEQEFFYGTETGGTIVSTGLHKVQEIINARFSPALYNLYLAQVSDGDNYTSDSPRCLDIMHQLLQVLQFAVYLEVTPHPSDPEYTRSTDLWRCYEKVKGENFMMEIVRSMDDVIPAFRKFFLKRTK